MTIKYDTDRIYNAGQAIVEDTGVGYDEFTAIKRGRVMPYLEQTPIGFAGIRPLEYAISRHMARIQAAYDWQLAMGNTLKHVADAVRQQDQANAQSFAYVERSPQPKTS